jgi:hypothetical protein
VAAASRVGRRVCVSFSRSAGERGRGMLSFHGCGVNGRMAGVERVSRLLVARRPRARPLVALAGNPVAPLACLAPLRVATEWRHCGGCFATNGQRNVALGRERYDQQRSESMHPPSASGSPTHRLSSAAASHEGGRCVQAPCSGSRSDAPFWQGELFPKCAFSAI